ncbi:uncharacterized protein [Typha latifolia]|uniref:uncharacterized protein n=1 Tax=Typha latifolia TaxID=4733 RepID=UPI003C309BCC
MGICTSCEAAAAVSRTAATAKLILPDGELREFATPVRASHVTERDHAFFVCDADVMQIDGFVSAIGTDEELRLGQLYFLLPRSMLKRPLHAEELAALAVKASAALVKAAHGVCGSRGRRGLVSPLAFAEASEEENVAVKTGEKKRVGGRGRKFSPDLSAIPE